METKQKEIISPTKEESGDENELEKVERFLKTTKDIWDYLGKSNSHAADLMLLMSTLSQAHQKLLKNTTFSEAIR